MSAPRKAAQVLNIEFRVVQALYHEGSGGSQVRCRCCGDRPKRYMRLILESGLNAFLCRDCFDKVGGVQDGYDQDSDFDSDDEY